MTSWTVLDTSLEILRAAADVPPGLHDAPTPCSAWTVAQVLEHAALDQGIWAACVGGTPGPDGDAFAPTGTADSAALVGPAVAAALAAWSGVTDGEVPTPLPQGPMPAATAAAACALDAAIHGWDVAVATGRPSPLTDDLAARLLPVALGFVEPLRQYGVFAAAVPAGTADTAADTLLRYLGRDPRWTP